ncbi:MAG TPA: D-alanyl-D-alanine carboxypeptidase/D-alanyl-D-alanine-endopeptidase [Gemmatimonadaceae bacterium]|nr:D-alanyl-D-alanine carboxypeptidase/D-alanyl-D-alanine-endopeptidase [Gemmatimonadaceae bacterium]
MDVLLSLRSRSRIASAVLLAAMAAVLSVPVRLIAQNAVDDGDATVAAADGDGGAAANAAVHAPPSTRRAPARRRARAARRPAAFHYDAPRSAAGLAGDLGMLLFSRVRSGQWGAMVVSLTRGDTLYAFNAGAALRPASNMKLFTAALALDEFGPRHQFSTDVLRDGPFDGQGTLHGNLILRGGGAPGLSERYLPGGPSAPMDLLAQLVVGQGIRHVTGDLIADATAFDTARVPRGWKHRYLHASYAARVSALSLDGNLVWVVVHPGSGSSQPAAVSLDPATDVPVRASVRTLRRRGSHVITYTEPDGAIVVRGWIGWHTAPRRYHVVVEHPAVFAAGALREALAAQGVTVEGRIRLGVTPASAVPVASLPSPPLARLISAMNRESINHFAELLFRDAGRRASPTHVGSVESGATLLERFMAQKVGAAPGTVYTTDGCGLSVLDHVTPRSLVQLLSYANRAPWSDAFHASLPVAGESELLRDRMRRTPAQGNLHAKTGTTSTVISLGGYVTARDGELLTFAFLYNGHDRWRAKETIDEMGATLANFMRN